ncbi:MAG: gluconate 2-dehydrogenase subunit 3 family protein [Bacteroidota bacterium]
MTRREVIQKSALALGYALSSSAVAGILKGCAAKPDLNYQPVFFTKDQALLISEVAEIILPRTATPGAKDVGVPAFIDRMVNEIYHEEQQQRFVTDLNTFNEDAKKQFGSDFIDCTPAQQNEFVVMKNKEALTEGGGVSEGWWAAGRSNERPFILKIKELTIIGFFTSEAGATQVLQYNPVPGPYQGCVPLADVGKAWAT